ncbi:MAG: GyrI-like domain-containing protein [Leptothrix sp. (in: b-proteobacteria)]
MSLPLIDRPAMRLIARRHTGPYGEPVGRFWRDVIAPWVQSMGWAGRVQVGIGRDDPRATPAEACRYDVGVLVDATEPLPPGDAFEVWLPAGPTWVAPFHGTPATIGIAMGRLLFETVPAHGLVIAGSPYELYRPDGEFDAATGAFSCELCVPVRRAG